MPGEPDGGVVAFARERLLRRIENAQERIWLASPFISMPVAKFIREAVEKSPAKERRLLTALEARSVQCGVLSPAALEQLRDCDFSIASIANLHAKVAVVDDGWGLVGSGNLTGAGLGDEAGEGNYEMGVLLTSAQIEVATDTLAGWWRQAERVSAEQIAYYKSLPKFPKGPARKVGPTLFPPMTTALEAILAEDPATAASRRYWINTNYHDPGDERWWRRDWVSDGSPKSYEKGDLLVIYLGKENNGPQRCPAVLRVERPSRHEPDFVLEQRDFEAAEQWPFVTKTSVVAEVPPSMGALLSAANKTYHSVQRGCELTRTEFEGLARALLP